MVQKRDEYGTGGRGEALRTTRNVENSKHSRPGSQEREGVGEEESREPAGALKR